MEPSSNPTPSHFEPRPLQAYGEWGIWVVFAFLLLGAYLPTFRWMIQRWDESDSYMSHGWLIPPLAAWLLWRERKTIAAAAGSGAASGLGVIAAALAIHLVAGVADVSSISGLTLIPVLLGFTALRFGWGLTRQAWFPITFLLCMVPPPEFIINGINFNLKLFAADIAAGLLNVTGLPAVRTGSFMLFGSEKLAIGDVCSGLRSLLALLTLGILYAWLIRSKGVVKVLAVLAATIPAAIIGNGLRIGLVAYLVDWLGHDRVFTPLIGSWDLHLFTGAIIFMADLAVLAGVSAASDRFIPSRRRPTSGIPE